jgi:5-methylcytosine-specific restriction protein A
MIRRRKLSTRERSELFEKHAGICHICNQPIVAGQKWEVSHIIPLGLGGTDSEENRAPAHKRPCHEFQTRVTDIPAIARAKRTYAKHIGAYRPQRPMPFGLGDRLKRRVDGQVVVRATGEPVFSSPSNGSAACCFTSAQIAWRRLTPKSCCSKLSMRSRRNRRRLHGVNSHEQRRRFLG